MTATSEIPIVTDDYVARATPSYVGAALRLTAAIILVCAPIVGLGAAAWYGIERLTGHVTGGSQLTAAVALILASVILLGFALTALGVAAERNRGAR